MWFMLMLVLSVLQAWTSDVQDVPRNPHTRGCSHFPRKLPPALAGQTEPSPSSWEVWSPSTSYSRAGHAPSLEEQKTFTCGWNDLLMLPLRKGLWFYHILSYSQQGRKEEPWVQKCARFSCPTHRALYLCTHSQTHSHVLDTHSQ